MSITPVNPVVEMLIGGSYVDITPDVRLNDAHSGGGIRIKRGVPNEGNSAEPTEFSFVLNNAGGKYSPKNELSVNYGKLGRNTPVRVALSRFSDSFAHAETDSWGRMPDWTDTERVVQKGPKWRLVGGATRFDIASGSATIASTTGTSAAIFGTYGDVEILTRVKTSVRDSEFGIVMRMRTPFLDEQDWESGQLGWFAAGGTSTLAASAVQVHTGGLSGLLTVAGSPATATARGAAVSVLAGRGYRGRMWVRCSATRTVTAAIDWLDSVGGAISTSTADVAVTANTWTVIEVSANAPETAFSARYGPQMGTSPANATLLYLDDLEMFEIDGFDMYTAYITPGTPDQLRLGTLAHDGTAFAASQAQTTNIVAGDFWWMKAQVTGIRRRVKWWKDGTAEPKNWNWRTYELGANDGRIRPGKVGMVGLYAKDGTSVVSFDSIQVTVWRAHAEITELPPRWDMSREDQWVPITAKGVLRRLGQGRKSSESSTTLYLRSYPTTKAWAPLESFEADGFTVPNLADNARAPAAHNLTGGTPDQTGAFALPGVAGYADFAEDDSSLTVFATSGAPGGTWSYLNFFRVPANTPSDVLLYKVASSGTARTWLVILAAGGGIRIQAYAQDGTSLVSVLGGFYGSSDLPLGSWVAANLYLSTSGGTVSWAWNYHRPGGTVFYTQNGTFAGDAGVFLNANYQSNAVLTTAGHLQLTQCFHYPGDLPFVTNAFARAAYAYIGEEAITRWARLADNIGVPQGTTGLTTESKALGAQTMAKPRELMAEAAEVDASIEMEERDGFGLNLRTRESLWNQVPLQLDIDLGHLTEPLEPTDDDQATRNDVTVSRPNGGSARSVQTEGPLNVNYPEDDQDGVGIYDETPELNFASDNDLLPAANWRRSRGTLDVTRYPAMTANLNSAPFDEDPETMWALLALDSGDLIKLTNREVSNEPTLQMIQGYEEFIDQYDYTLNFTTKPGQIYSVGVVGYSTRLQTSYQTLTSTFVAGTGTRLSATRALPGALWVQVADDPRGFPFDIVIQGCRLRVHTTGNLLNSNPWFDTDLAGYDPLSATLYWDRRIGFTRTEGNPCCRATATSTTNIGPIGNAATQIAATPGEVFHVSAWIKTDTSVAVQARLGCYNAASGFISSAAGPAVTIPANTWTHVAAEVTTPALTAFVRPSPVASLATAGIAWFDDIRVMRQSTYNASPQTLSVEQTPVYGVIKTLTAGAPITVADPWRLAF